MTFDVEVGGERVAVSVRAESGSGRHGGRFAVTTRRLGRDGAEDAVEAVVVDARSARSALSLVFPDGRSVEAAVTHSSGGAVLVQLPHVDVSLVVDDKRRARRRDAPSETGEQRVVAPMPGRILKVLVAAGDEVRAGQAVVVIEAMKMENDLKVARDGRVREVLVAELSSVEAGRLLVVVE